MPKDNLIDLAERCEKATGEDLFLFREVGHAAFAWDGDTDNIPDGLWRYEAWLEKGAFIEAAMSLVPEGWHASTIIQDRWKPERWFVALRKPGGHEAHAKAPFSLALTAACLRAIANGAQGHG